MFIGLKSGNESLDVFASRQPDLRPVPTGIGDSYNYFLYADFSVNFILSDAVYQIVIPRGFVSDGTSIPRVLQSLAGITHDGLERRASWTHDWLYSNLGKVSGVSTIGKDGSWEPSSRVFSRDECDLIFKWLLSDTGTSKDRTNLLYFFVHTFGGIAWASHMINKK